MSPELHDPVYNAAFCYRCVVHDDIIKAGVGKTETNKTKIHFQVPPFRFASKAALQNTYARYLQSLVEDSGQEQWVHVGRQVHG